MANWLWKKAMPFYFFAYKQKKNESSHCLTFENFRFSTVWKKAMPFYFFAYKQKKTKVLIV
ncbi:hypothetical protein C1904_10350 [Listeria ivanovii]|nr:hypothetical protein C1905_10340 [Listeria ivanovii]PZG25638.1 hypothetical protein C1900_10350 [Listeria ivanovii]PZG26787.1 hypothetical protein C1904_10350 [Listeria ivanovii]PZG83959.1 hypothetical protein C1906_10110 [Listeria ivanovii]